MRLIEYLVQNKMKTIEFACKLDVSQTTIYRCFHGYIPNDRTVEKIHIETNGQVTREDFLEHARALGIKVSKFKRGKPSRESD